MLFNVYGMDRVHSREQATPYINIKGCEFRYFMREYEALIYVENNNYHTDTSLERIKSYNSFLGEDRGMDLTIDNSLFEYSRFCKGMIVYRSSPFSINSDSTLYNYTHEVITSDDKLPQ